MYSLKPGTLRRGGVITSGGYFHRISSPHTATPHDPPLTACIHDLRIADSELTQR
jgi:hypothetical protein